jgi:integrase/recombinase XerC
MYCVTLGDRAMTVDLFSSYCQQFIQHLTVERNTSLHTIRAYTSDLNQFIEFWQRINTEQACPIRQVLDRYFVLLYNKKMNKSSIARKTSCFSSLQLFLKKNGIEINLKIVRPRTEKKLPVFLTVEEMSKLLDKVPIDQLPTKRPYRDKAILEVLYATGIRCSELIAIKLQDIDFTQKTIRIFGKGKKERIVLFGSKAHEMLLRYIEKERPPFQHMQEPFFLNYTHEALTTRSVQRIVAMFRPFLKVQRPITPHKIRHSFATHLLNKGANIRVVQELLGHKSLSSTEQYTHVTTKDLSHMCETLHPLNKKKDDIS